MYKQVIRDEFGKVAMEHILGDLKLRTFYAKLKSFHFHRL